MADVEDEEAAEETEASGEADEADRKQYGLPRFLTLSDGRRIDTRKSTIPAKSHFVCGKCGLKQDVRLSVESFGHGAPVATYAVHCHCPDCDAEGRVYGGRYFAGLGAMTAAGWWRPSENGLLVATPTSQTSGREKNCHTAT